MSSELVQSAIAFGCVGVAASFIARRLWVQATAFRKGGSEKTACDTCGSCGTSKEPKVAQPQLITLSAPPRRITPTTPPDRARRN